MRRFLVVVLFAGCLSAQIPINQLPADTNSLPNDSTGTTAGYFLSMAAATGTAVALPCNSTSGNLGVALAGAGTTGSVYFASRGGQTVPVVLENSATIGHWVIPCTGATAGKGRDSGSTTKPTSGLVLGQIQATTTPYTGMVAVTLEPPDTVVANVTGCSVAGSSGDLQENNGSGGCGASNLNDNGTAISLGKPLALLVTAGTGGVTAGHLVRKDASNPTAYVNVTGTESISGVATATVSAAATFRMAIRGIVGCVVEGSVTAGNYAIAGTTDPTACKDSGQSARSLIPASTALIGVFQANGTNGQTININVEPLLNGIQNLRTFSITDLAPVTGDSGLILISDPQTSITLTRLYCAIQGSTSATVDLDKRAEGSIGTDSGAHLLGSTLTAVSGGANTSTFGNGSGQCGSTSSCAIAAHSPVVLIISAVSGTPTALDCSLEYY